VRILILGGTRFVGRHIVDAALERGHEPTLFHRGVSNARIYPELEHIHGDRNTDVGTLRSRGWDAVIDTSGYTPGPVAAAADAVAGAEHYTFISTISVYREPIAPGTDEDSPLAVLPPGSDAGEVTGPTYGPLKVLCEREVHSRFGDRALLVRAGLIVGPLDPTGRLPYWVHRVGQGGDVLAPGHPDRPVQLIDARDLGEWVIRMMELRQGGAFNATGPGQGLTMDGMLRAIDRATGSPSGFEWVDDAFLLERGLTHWKELPFWLPDGNGLFEIDVTRAVAAGLTFRPVEATMADTHQSIVAGDTPVRSGDWLSREREAELLREWRSSGARGGD
jgi:2'-hydroxyisoflavone reductase